jgi:circadian clock protein KaiB
MPSTEFDATTPWAAQASGLDGLVSPSLADPPELRLLLFIAGDTLGAQRALDQQARLLDALGPGIDIEVIDILASPERAEAAGVLATPTLSNESCKPPRRIVGDLSDVVKVIEFLGLPRRSVSA